MNTPQTPDAAQLQKAFEHLGRYTSGAGRGTLVPIDDAIAAALRDEPRRAELETRLTAVVRGDAAVVAKEYACGKLALIGGPACVPALTALLAEESLAHATINALQALPCAEAGTALAASLTRVAGPTLVGVLHALAKRRHVASTGPIAALLEDPNPPVAAAAAGALGEIGTPAAAEALRTFLPKAPDTVRIELANAGLMAAERLTAEGEGSTARALLDALLAAAPPPHVRAAVTRLAP